MHVIGQNEPRVLLGQSNDITRLTQSTGAEVMRSGRFLCHFVETPTPVSRIFVPVETDSLWNVYWRQWRPSPPMSHVSSRHGRGLGSSMGWVGLGPKFSRLKWVGLDSVTRIYIFFAIIIIKRCKSVTAIYPMCVNSSEVPPVRRCVLLIYLSGFTVCSLRFVHFCNSMDLSHCIKLCWWWWGGGGLWRNWWFANFCIFSCVLLQLTHYVDICCGVGLGPVRSAYISCGLG